MWCECGTSFPAPDQADPPKQEYKPEYDKAYLTGRGARAMFEYQKRVYMPLIEDLTYGRRFLEVGYVGPYGLDFVRERGWVPFGLDICRGADPGDHRHAYGDFLRHEFKPPLSQFDCVWMGHVIEHFPNPPVALARAYDVLDSSGLIFVSSPDTDFLHRVGTRSFGHFHSGEHTVLYRVETFAKIAEKIGFTTVLARKSAVRRGTTWNEFHYIGQKK